MSTDANAPEGTEGTPNPETPAEVTIESLTAEIEALKGHSRKWEDRAKDNFEAKKALDALNAEKMTEEEKRTAADAARSESLRLAEERAATAEQDVLRFKIAAKHGLSDEDAVLLLTASDEETMTRQAERFAGRTSGPRPNPAQGRSGKAVPTTPGEAFADAMSELF